VLCKQVFAERLNTSSTALPRADIDPTSTFAGGMGRWCGPGSGCESEWGDCVFNFPPKGRCSGEQAFTYTASGKENHVPGEGVRSAFSFHVFRYARVRGWPLPTPIDRTQDGETASDSNIPLHRFTAMRLHTDNIPAATDPLAARETIAGHPPVPTEPSFRTSSPLLNEIDALAAAAFRSNWIGIQSDCPGRERLGYGGDQMVSAEAGLYMFDSANFYAKRAQDYVDARRSNGGLPETAPFVGIATCDTLKGHAGAGPMQWGATLPHTLQLLHMHANDTTTLQKHFQTAVEWMDLLKRSRQANGVLANGLVGFVDSKSQQGGVCDPAFTGLMGTAFFFQQCTIMERLARVMGDDALVVKYQSLANQTATAFNEQFYSAESAVYGNATDDEQVYALGLGLVPVARVPAVLNGLLERVRARGGAFVVDAFGVWLVQNLVPLGAGEAVMNWMLSEEYPSYGYMIRNKFVNATTMMEHWDTMTENDSHNHAWLNSVALFYRSGLLGLAPVAPGWSEIRVRPWPLAPGRLSWAAGHVRTPQGTIFVKWNASQIAIAEDAHTPKVLVPPGRRFVLEVAPPANVRVYVHVPLPRQGAEVDCCAAATAMQQYELGARWWQIFTLHHFAARTMDAACEFSTNGV
jgi:hypothetical protein